MKNSITLTLFVWMFGASAMGQIPNIIKSDSILYAVHKAHIGKITFMKQVIPIESYQETDMIQIFEIKEKTDLNIRVFLENSLTNYLHSLAPQLSEEELVEKGNFQFSFELDGIAIYTENLHPGAFGADNKNKKTVFRVPLISSTNEDSWGRYLWNRFLANGGENALTTGEHLLNISIRPYLQNNGQLLTGSIIAQGQLSLIVPVLLITEAQIQIQKIKPLKDWAVSLDHMDTAKIEALNRKIAEKKFKEITSIVVVKNGNLLLEEYFNGANRSTLHDTRSVGKSFASTMLGIAVKDGYIKNEQQMLKDFYDLRTYSNYSAAKDSISLKSLLTMSSPFDGSDQIQESPGNEENMYPTSNWVKFALDLPVDKSKVANPRWDYFTAGVVVLGDIIHQSVPGGLEKYAAKKLFKPLGIRKYKWQHTPQKVANTAGSLQLRSVDIAKYGLLYQNKGIANRIQILPEEWVEKSLSKQVPISESEYYGYLFWNKTYRVGGKDYEVYYSSGNGGNKIFIFKDYPIVVVITATAYNTPYGHKQVDTMMQEYLISAVLKE